MENRNPGRGPLDPSQSLDPAGMKAALRPGQRLLGLDLGTKTIGLAVSDALWMVASPLVTIKRTKFTRDARELLAVCERHEVGGLVLGLPVEMDGTEGKRCQSTRQFAANLRGLDHPLAGLPLAFWDERLSTAAVERMMIDEMDMTRKKRAASVDKAAAAYILQGFLDAMARA